MPDMISTEFSRALLTVVHKDVKAAYPRMNLNGRDFWVWKVGRDQWQTGPKPGTRPDLDLYRSLFKEWSPRTIARYTHRPVHPARIVKRSIDVLGMTVEAFADHIGTSRQTVHAIIAGRSAVGAEMAVRLGRAFHPAVLAQHADQL